MKLTCTIKIAFKNLVKNKMRSVLTSLGVIIGVGSVIVMIAVGTGSQQKIKNQIASLGSNLLIISQNRERAGGVFLSGDTNRLTLDDAENIKKYAPSVRWVSPFIQNGSQVIAGGQNWNTSVYGVSPDFINIRDWEIEEGSFFTESDNRVKKKVAVLGKTVADQLFPGQDPIGMTIRVRNVPFRVSGVLAAKGRNAFGMNQDDLIMAPAATVMTRLSGSRFIRSIYVSAWSEKLMGACETEIKEAMRISHKLKPGQEDDFTIGTQDEIIQMATSTAVTLTLLLGAIAGVSLLVGGIGIMNIMLVSVTERTREIGLRMAVGARRKDILMQFLIEALVLSIVGGILGIIIAVIISLGLNIFTSISTVINVGIIFLSFLFSGSVGVFFGFFPARKAARLDPIDALKYE
jgi:putative ABC transport system permease protein